MNKPTDCTKCRYYSVGYVRIIVDNRAADEYAEDGCDAWDMMPLESRDLAEQDQCPCFSPYSKAEIEERARLEAEYLAEMAREALE